MKRLVPAGQVGAHEPKAAPPTTPAVNSGELAIIRSQAGLNSFTLAPKQGIENTAAEIQTLTARTTQQLERGPA